MVFFVCGLSHIKAPLNVREKMALPTSAQDTLLRNLINLPSVHEAAMLSTCNRTEFYCDSEDPELLLPWLIHMHGIEENFLLPYFYQHQGHEAIRHLLRVGSGLDSMVVGEPQVFGQMKQAYQQACRLGTIKTNLRSIFEYIFSASKRVRKQSGIGLNPVSIAYAAVQLLSQSFVNYDSLRVFLIGAGETNRLVAKYLYKNGVRNFYIASRTRDNAEALASTCQGKAVNIGDIPNYLAFADVVISATACPLPFINQSLVQHALKERAEAPMFFLDLAVPRDIEAEVRALDKVTLYDLDDLQTMIAKGMNERRSRAIQAEQLIDGELDNYLRKYRSLRANAAICDYRQRMQSLAEEELSRAQAKLIAGRNQEEVLRELCSRMLHKLAHNPTEGLKKAANDERDDLLSLTHYLFTDVCDPIPL